MLLVLSCLASWAHADEGLHCKVLPNHEPTAAEKALLSGHADQAEKLYRDALASTPNDPGLTAGLVQVLLAEQKLSDAETIVQSASGPLTQSVAFLVALGNVKYREGKIGEAATSADQAYRIDPCNPKMYLLRARILKLNSMYASERRAIAIAHALDPWDPQIRGIWINTLPISKRVEEEKAFLSSDNGLDAEQRGRAEKYLNYLIRRTVDPGKSCHLASSFSPTQIPFVPVFDGSRRHTGRWGLNVSINNSQGLLDLDTGASGLVINRALAERAGLKPMMQAKLGGIGDQGAQNGYITYANSIRIGSLEFRDCAIEVADRKDVVGIDGLIGSDVFKDYLITLDYPMRKVTLAALPQLPNTSEGTGKTLSTDTGEDSGIDLSESQDRFIDPSMKDYFPLFRSGHLLILPTVLNGKVQKQFAIDTGAFACIVSPEAAREVTKVRGDSGMEVSGLNGKVKKVYSSDTVVLHFADVTQQNNDIVTFDTSSVSRSAGMEISGFIGNSLLRELTIHIDYRDGLIKFDYDRKYGNHNYN